MISSRFAAWTRSLISPRSRRSLFAAGLTTALFNWPSPGAARCNRVGANCERGGECCTGARCRRGRCRCKSGWTACGKYCRRLASDPANCGACGETCSTGCCAGGACREPCGDLCCAECFAEAIYVDDEPIDGTEFCCDSAAVCNPGSGDPGDDLCCWPDEACIDGACCCDGCEGTVVCGGVCCPSVSCCNGACCGSDQVCALQSDGALACVNANRSCAQSSNCFADETCHGGICCSGDRICANINGPICCPLSKHCDPDSGFCCDNGVTCGTTAKKVRIRP